MNLRFRSKTQRQMSLLVADAMLLPNRLGNNSLNGFNFFIFDDETVKTSNTHGLLCMANTKQVIESVLYLSRSVLL